MRSSVLIAGIVAMVGCKDSTAPVASVDMSGEWALFEQTDIRGSPYVRHCETQGNMTISHTRGTFTGSFSRDFSSCEGFWLASWAYPVPATAPLVDGKFKAPAVEFRIGVCTYRGALHEEDTMVGTLDCPIPGEGQAADSGNWSAMRKASSGV